MIVATAGVLRVWSLRELSMAADRDRNGGIQRPPAGPLDGGGGENSDPEAAVRSEGLLQGEVVGVDLREVDRRGAGDGGAVDEGERSRGVDAVDGGDHAG